VTQIGSNNPKGIIATIPSILQVCATNKRSYAVHKLVTHGISPHPKLVIT